MTQWLHPSQCKVILAAVKYAMCTENILLTRILYSRKCLEDVHYIMMYGRIDWTLEQHRSVRKFILKMLKFCSKNFLLEIVYYNLSVLVFVYVLTDMSQVPHICKLL